MSTFTPPLRIREKVPMRQYLLVTPPGGRPQRWGEDEPGADKVFEDLVDSDSVPGGCKELSCSLPRKPGVDYGDMKRGTDVELRGVGRYRVWKGTLQDAPRSSGDKLVMSPAAVGYQDDLNLDESAAMIFIDGDQGAWSEPSVQRRINLINGGLLLSASASSGWQDAGATGPGLFFDFSGVIKEEGKTVGAELWYDAGGAAEIERIIFDFLGDATGAFETYARISADDINTAGTFDTTGNLLGATAALQSVTATGRPRRFASLRDFHNGAGVKGALTSKHAFQNVKLIGPHHLPLYGAWPNIGVRFSDVLAYIVGRWAPRIKFTTGRYGSIRPTTFNIPHLSFREPTTGGDMAAQGNRFELNEYGVWPGEDGPTMHLNPRGQREGRKRWRAKMKDCKFEDAGASISRVCNGVVVVWQDVGGKTKAIGPPTSGYRLTSSKCVDLDPLNPANEIPGMRKWKKIAMKRVANTGGAEETAQRFLEGLKLLDGSGQATFVGYVEDENGMLWPYDRVKSGDVLTVLDSSNHGDRYLTSVNRTRASRSAAATIDAPPDSFEAFLERLDVEELAF